MGETVEKVKGLWETWDIRGLMLTSLLIQILLTFLAPLRKRCANSFLKIFLWILYLSADAVALFTIGLISSKGADHDPPKGAAQHADLLAFWAPFLLLHLGGPDTITALALEDNELWRRHALQFATQVAVTLYVFVQSFRQNKRLLAPTLLMFIDGCIKYLERTCALYNASMDNFRDSHRRNPETGPDYARLMEEYSGAIAVSIPAKIQGKDADTGSQEEIGPPRRPRPVKRHDSLLRRLASKPMRWLPAIEEERESIYRRKEDTTETTVRLAYANYRRYKGILADAFLSLEDRDESRLVFLNRPAREVFRLVEIELNYIYDVFYTKLFLLQSRQGYARVLSFLSITASVLLFSLMEKRNYHDIDVGITFALLGGGIALDIISTIMFLLSDWYIVFRRTSNLPKRIVFNVLVSIANLLSCCCYRCFCSSGRGLKSWWFSRSRWSQSISKYSLLQQCLKDPPSFLEHSFMPRGIRFGLKNLLIEWLYVHKNRFDKQLGDFIFEELHKKADLADDPQTTKEVCSARGNLVLQDSYIFVSEFLQPWTVDIDYDESLLTWHLATDLCYWTQNSNSPTTDEKTMYYRQFSKDLSDYMSYLFLSQKALLSPVLGTSDTRLQDTYAEARKFINKRFKLDGWSPDALWMVKKYLCLQTSVESNERREKEEELLKQCSDKVLEVKAVVRSIEAKGDKSKSVFFDACRLAKQLKMFGNSQWEITVKVWVELLCYAALRCASRSHIAQLSNGGELITLVWLLMNRLGLAERFRQTRGYGWTKLIIPK